MLVRHEAELAVQLDSVKERHTDIVAKYKRLEEVHKEERRGERTKIEITRRDQKDFERGIKDVRR